MSVIFGCPCGNQLKTDEKYIGQQVRCPRCNRVLTVPAAGVTAQPAAAAPPPPPPPQRPVTPEPPPRPRNDERIAPEPPPRTPAATPTGTSGKAIAAVVLGVIALCGSSSGVAAISSSWSGLLATVGGTFCSALLFGVPAIYLGFRSLRDIKASHGALAGKGLANIGLALGIGGTVCSLLCCMGCGTYGAKNRVEDASARMQSSNNLKQIGLAMHNYADSNTTLPPAAIYSKEGKPLLSWRVMMLPYIEAGPLYSKFHLDEPWDSNHNKALLAQMPKTYTAPGSEPGTDQTFYRVFHMKERPGGTAEFLRPPFVGRDSVTLSAITSGRGTSNTFLVVEAAESVPWTKPDELPYPVNGLVEAQLGGVFKGGYHVLLVDGSVRFYPKGHLTDKDLQPAITINSTEPGLPE